MEELAHALTTGAGAVHVALGVSCASVFCLTVQHANSEVHVHVLSEVQLYIEEQKEKMK